MKLNACLFQALVTLSLFAVSADVPVRAQDLSQPVTLVATEHLEGTPYARTVLVAAPTSDGGHIGFIINRPTEVKLERLLPDQASAHNVTDPVYLGGPRHIDKIFALTRAAPNRGGDAIPLLPGLFAVIGAQGLDQILEQRPNDARYFVGMFVWEQDELESQIRAGIWTVKPADASAVFRKQTNRLWSELRATIPRSGVSGSWL